MCSPAAAARRPSSAIGSGSVPSHTAGLIQACGVEHRRAAGHHIGEDVAAGIGCAAHRLLGRAGAGELDRIGEVDAHLEHLWFGVEHRGQAGDEILGGKKPPALAQMQPEPSADLLADLRKLGAGPVGGAGIGRIRETRSARCSVARSWADRPASTTRKRPTRDTSVQQCRNEFSVCSVAARSGPATRLTVTSASRGPATRLLHQRIRV